MKRLVLDVDDTISFTTAGDYAHAAVNHEVVEKIRSYKNLGFEIVLYTARNMRTYENNVGKINANMLPVMIDWLREHDIPFDEIITGKPWCGKEGFYVDDKAIRPDEFTSMSYEEIKEMVGISK